MISLDDYLWYADNALDEMARILSDLGDEHANQKPTLPGANSPYAILTHCLGVMEYWGGGVIAGRSIDRDRASEFVATGAVEDLLGRTRAARTRLAADLESFDPGAEPRGEVRADDAATPVGRTQGGVLFHIYEELSQHLGQMEITRDVLLHRSPST